MKTQFIAILICLSGCSCQGSKPLAVVGKTSLTQLDLEAFARARGLDPRKSEVQTQWIERERLAELARGQPWSQSLETQATLRASQEELLAQAVVERESAGSSGDAELRARFEKDRASLGRWEVHVQHLVLRKSLDPKHNAENAVQIQQLYAESLAGKDFSELVREHSEDAPTAAKGGDLGVVREGDVDSVFFEAARQLHAGQVGKPLETAVGWHLLRAVDEPVKREPSFEEASGRLKAALRHEAEQQVVAKAAREVPTELHFERLKLGQGRAP